MGSYIATFRTAKGELKSTTIKAENIGSAKRLLRRRGIKTEDIKSTQSEKGNKPKAGNISSSIKSQSKKNNNEPTNNKSFLSADLGKLFEKALREAVKSIGFSMFWAAA